MLVLKEYIRSVPSACRGRDGGISNNHYMVEMILHDFKSFYSSSYIALLIKFCFYTQSVYTL